MMERSQNVRPGTPQSFTRSPAVRLGPFGDIWNLLTRIITKKRPLNVIRGPLKSRMTQPNRSCNRSTSFLKNQKGLTSSSPGYLKGTMNYRLKYEEHPIDVNVYCDANFANDQITSKSITGVLAFVFGNLVDWYSRSQKRVANSTCHVEVQAIVDGATEGQYLFCLMAEMKVDEVKHVTLFNDNPSGLATVNKSGKFERNKHYRMDINLVGEMVQAGWLKIVYCPTDNMLADYLTKPLVECKLAKLTRESGIEQQ